MTLIEKMARGMARDIANEHIEIFEDVDAFVEQTWQSWVPRVRAALQAARDLPTDYARTASRNGDLSQALAIKWVWQDVIDAALSEQPQ